jgi:hypothetical protein
MKTAWANRMKKPLRQGLHYALIANGISALAGIVGAMTIRSFSHQSMAGADARIFDILLGAVFISYCLAECERRNQLLYGVTSAIVLTSLALTALRFPERGWVRSFAAIFASMMAMKPLSAWISKVLSSTGRGPECRSHLSRRHGLGTGRRRSRYCVASESTTRRSIGTGCRP